MQGTSATPSLAPRVGKDLPRAHVTAFLDAWERLCFVAGAAKGRRCLRTREVPTAGSPAEREALGAALAALGYPEAMMNGQRMGQALRHLRGPAIPLGRYLSSSKGAGGAIWYVVGTQFFALGCVPGCRVVGGEAIHANECVPPF